MLALAVALLVTPALARAGGLAQARALARAGEAYAAASEAKRFLFFTPDAPTGLRQEAQAIIAAARAGEEGPRPVAREASSGLSSRLFRLYQARLKSFRAGGGCPSHPSCSVYALEAAAKHGGWLGAFMAYDRLVREITEKDEPPFVWKNGVRLHLDPVEANDWWFKREDNP